MEKREEDRRGKREKECDLLISRGGERVLRVMERPFTVISAMLWTSYPGMGRPLGQNYTKQL